MFDFLAAHFRRKKLYRAWAAVIHQGNLDGYSHGHTITTWPELVYPGHGLSDSVYYVNNYADKDLADKYDKAFQAGIVNGTKDAIREKQDKAEGFYYQ